MYVTTVRSHPQVKEGTVVWSPWANFHLMAVSRQNGKNIYETVTHL